MTELFTILRKHAAAILIGFVLFATLLFGETFQVYFIFLLIGMTGVFIFRTFGMRRLSAFEYVILSAWFVYLLAFAIATSFSHVFVDSLHKLIVQIAVFIWFITVLCVPKKLLRLESGIILSVGLLLLLLLLAIAFPFLSVSGQIPNSNVLIARHGHNLLAGIFVLIVPVVWQYGRDKFAQNKIVSNVLFVTFSIIMALTFSRSALLIMLLQFGWLFWTNSKESVRGSVSKILFPLVLLAAFLVLPYTNCTNIPMSLQLCKPLSKEMRPEYWRQAVVAVKEYPVFGYSVGTFSPISHKYSNAPHAIVKYSHNAWLEQFSTGGIVVGFSFLILTGLIISVPLRALRKLRRRSSLQIGLSLGILGFFLNSLVGYDWNIFGSQLLFVFFVGLLLREVRGQQKFQLSPKLPNWSSILLALLLMLFSIGYYIVDFQIRSGRVSQAYVSFPYYFFHKPIYFNSAEISFKNIEEMSMLFAFDPEFQGILFQANQDSSFPSLSPWSQLSYGNTMKLLEVGRVDEAAGQLKLFQQRLIAGELRNLFVADYQKKEMVALNILSVANKYLADKKYLQAAEMYHLAVELDEWSISKQSSINISEKPDREMIIFFALLKDIPTEKYGVHGEQFVKLSLLLLKNIDELNLEEVQLLAQRAIAFDKNAASNIWKTTSVASIDSNDVSAVDKWFVVWSVLSENNLSFEYAFQEDLATALIVRGNVAVISGEATIGKYYSEAMSVIPWAASFAPHFLTFTSPDTLTDEQVLEYAETMLGKRGDALGWNFVGHSELFARAAELTTGVQHDAFLNESKLLKELD